MNPQGKQKKRRSLIGTYQRDSYAHYPINSPPPPPKSLGGGGFETVKKKPDLTLLLLPIGTRDRVDKAVDLMFIVMTMDWPEAAFMAASTGKPRLWFHIMAQSLGYGMPEDPPVQPIALEPSSDSEEEGEESDGDSWSSDGGSDSNGSLAPAPAAPAHARITSDDSLLLKTLRALANNLFPMASNSPIGKTAKSGRGPRLPRTRSLTM